MKYLLLSICLAAPWVSAGEPETAALLERLERAIESEEIRAAVAGIYSDGQSKVVGLGRLSGTATQRPDGLNVFEIGSISKVFTSVLTQLQVDAGRLNWDDSLDQQLPKVKFSSAQVAAITLRELATHTSGLPRLPTNIEAPDPLDPYAGYGRHDLEQFLADFEPEKLIKEPAYSNLGVGLLGVIAADAAGGSYAQAMETQVLAAIGMQDSAVGLPKRLLPRLATGFSQGADMPNWDGFDALAGAGAIVSTAEDMLRFIRMNMESKSASDKVGQAIAAIAQPQGDGDIGLGWQIYRESGELILWHNGGTGGYASFLALRPDAGTALVILTSSTAYELVTELGLAWIAGTGAPEQSQNLDAYPGSYKLAEGFFLRIFSDGGRLFGQATGQGAFPLTPTGTHQYSFPPAKIVITFNDMSAGPAASLSMQQAGQTTQAARVAGDEGPRERKTIEVAAATLAAYAGRYQLAPGAVLTVEARGGQLYAQLTGQGALPVFPFKPDGFFYKVVDAQLEFERDATGTVTAVVLHQMGQRRAPRIDD